MGMTIGQLSLRTGVPVRTLRFYADAGVLPEAGRSESGYRLFGPDAVARARLVRTLRELGVGLDEVKRVLAGEAPLHDVAAAHARDRPELPDGRTRDRHLAEDGSRLSGIGEDGDDKSEGGG
jgi:DNA-binding transcriptional MerR regulator